MSSLYFFSNSVGLSPYQAMPLQVKPQILPTKNGGKFDISVHPRTTDGKPIESIVLSIPMPKSATSVNATCNVGNYMYDPVTKVNCPLFSVSTWRDANTTRRVWICMLRFSFFFYRWSNGKSASCSSGNGLPCYLALLAARKQCISPHMLPLF